MNGYHGPCLTYIARNEQQKLATAAQTRLAMSALPDTHQLPEWLHRWRAKGTAVGLRGLVQQGFRVFQAAGPLRIAAWRVPLNEDGDILDIRLSS